MARISVKARVIFLLVKKGDVKKNNKSSLTPVYQLHNTKYRNPQGKFYRVAENHGIQGPKIKFHYLYPTLNLYTLQKT